MYISLFYDKKVPREFKKLPNSFTWYPRQRRQSFHENNWATRCNFFVYCVDYPNFIMPNAKLLTVILPYKC